MVLRTSPVIIFSSMVRLFDVASTAQPPAHLFSLAYVKIVYSSRFIQPNKVAWWSIVGLKMNQSSSFLISTQSIQSQSKFLQTNIETDIRFRLKLRLLHKPTSCLNVSFKIKAFVSKSYRLTTAVIVRIRRIHTQKNKVKNFGRERRRKRRKSKRFRKRKTDIKRRKQLRECVKSKETERHD